MSSNDTKKKRESILESLARLNDQLNIAQIDGNKRKIDSIKRTMERLEKDLKALKSYS
jgi:archaellum component FlaC